MNPAIPPMPQCRTPCRAGALSQFASAGQNRQIIAIAAIWLAAPVAHAERVSMSTNLEDKNYEKIDRKKGVTVYQHKTSKVIRVAAEGRLPSDPDTVAAMLMDYPRQKGRIGRVSESTILSHNDKEIIVYQHLNLPIVSDRDFNLRITWGKDAASSVRWIDYKALKKRGRPPKKGVVRVTHHEGSWQLKPISGGRSTAMRLMVVMDVGGWIPKWMARSNAASELIGLFSEFRAMLREFQKSRGKPSTTGR